MALPMLVGGSECGPSNALQNLSKRFEQDRGIQQDFFGNRAGSSREAFRSQGGSSNSANEQEAARFFSATANGLSGSLVGSDVPFDVAAMRAALPVPTVQTSRHSHAPQRQAGPSAWATDFMHQTPLAAAAPLQTLHDAAQQQPHAMAVHSPAAGLQQAFLIGWTPAMQGFRMNSIPGFMPQLHAQPQPVVTSKRISWDREFSALELGMPTAAVTEELVQEQPREVISNKPFDGDELARTAGMLLSHVEHEQNPKFQKSLFLGLMKQLRDGEIIVEGNKMVESDGTRTSSSANIDVKGKGRAADPVFTPNLPLQDVRMGPIPQQARAGQIVSETDGVMEEEDPNDAYFRQENLDYANYWSREAAEKQGVTPDGQDWDRLQRDWDQFEATATGITEVSRYQFQENNPYLVGESSSTRHHLLHGGGRQAVLESVLELEAAVQRDLSNAGVWYELGVRQQACEREHKALQALQRAVELDPSLLPARLALAISYTNDNNRQGTYEAVSEWVNRNSKYADAVRHFDATQPIRANASSNEKFSRLIQCLITMARSDMSGDVDADIQIALAVLLNTNEEYEKAQDCFRAALAVRPEDCLLYNRVGATMANSGRAEEALQYYYKALELNPAYIRARFNLGISCINLRRYEEASQHILDALLLQDGDTAIEGGSYDKSDVISTALWDSLKTTCLHMQRADLSTLCDLKDLDGVLNNFVSVLISSRF
ncbi:TPR-like protein [Coprinopsis marcescibilis]|uniref:TPR-like protein n=1 Tax=Coprinopsis marcescibilis TaxID=230819 RepID=A0A5C3L1H2_COPMA|nr:TPR-like protein [Coprinopsis marcescibilis]